MKMYTVFDSQLKLYTKPYYARNKGEALRSFAEAVNDPQIFGKIAEHLTLFEVGDFNEETSRITAYDAMESCGNGLEWKKNPTDTQQSLFDPSTRNS